MEKGRKEVYGRKKKRGNGTDCCLPACRRLLFPLLHAATKEIGDVCTQARLLCET